MKASTLLFLTAIIFGSCHHKISVNKFSDATFQLLSDLQDKRAGDSISSFLNHENYSYRQAAALAYGSIQDSIYVPLLGEVLLTDVDSSVRRAAAFSLGQTPCMASENFLYRASQQEKSNSVLQEILNAYGKVATHWRLDFSSADSLLESSLGWSLFRMAYREVSDQELNSKAKYLLGSRHQTARLAAAHYFARGAKEYNGMQHELIRVATLDPSADVRMAAVSSLRKIQTDSALTVAIHVLKNDSDARVRVNAARALQDFPFASTHAALQAALEDSNAQVGVAASEVIKNSIVSEYAESLGNIITHVAHWRIKANLFEAMMKANGKEATAAEIQKLYIVSQNPYQKAALITALQHFLPAQNFVAAELLNTREQLIKSAAASVIVEMNYHPSFPDTLKQAFGILYESAIQQGDPAVVGTIANALGDSTLGYRDVIKNFEFLHQARKKLTLPKDFESVVPLEGAIHYFENRNEKPQIKNDFNNAIDWELVKSIPRDQHALVKTSKGDITLALFIEEAPGSVSNFVTLALKKFYDGKRFHRVVPNFVVQGGCPRGDGWGSENFSIRSEFSLRRYKTGSVGMASAGKDTEGTQWFITHSPTPHLDGRYTIFAEVVHGMDVVDKLEVSDTIFSVDILDFKLL